MREQIAEAGNIRLDRGYAYVTKRPPAHVGIY